MTGYRSLSMWLDGVPGELAPRASLPGPIDLDVAVVGARYSGLWTAYYLKKADPTLCGVAEERIDARFHLRGQLDLANSPVQLLRAREAVEHERSWGFGADDYEARNGRPSKRATYVKRLIGA